MSSYFFFGNFLGEISSKNGSFPPETGAINGGCCLMSLSVSPPNGTPKEEASNSGGATQPKMEQQAVP